MIYLIVASIEGREKYLKKFISSIKNTNTVEKYKIVIVRQYKEELFSFKDDRIKFINIKDFGASNARNLGLNFIKNKIKETDWVCFPDDDCYFNKNLLKLLLKYQNYDLVFGDIRDPDDKFRMGLPVHSKNSKLRKSFPVINCPSFFVKASKIHNFKFNEYYGPGAVIPAVEETEFLYRLSQIENLNCIYSSEIKIFHPYEQMSYEQAYRYAYSQGVLLKKIFKNKNFLIFLTYFKYLCRPFFAFVIKIIFLFSISKFYKVRCMGLLSGFFSGVEH
jgi:hypothetical protein